MNKIPPKVSIIIPVYNVAPYLRDCMDSVINQTLQEIEIICVNDGSTDESPSILEEYAQQDGRIRIISQENRGLSAARNVGIDLAKGKYVYFIDSDDILYLEAMEYLYGEAERNQLDVLHFDAEDFCETEALAELFSRIRTNGRTQEYNDIYEGAALFSEFTKHSDYQSTVWVQFYSRAFLLSNDLHFYEGILFEDRLFTFISMFLSDRTSHRQKILYKRRVREGSITTSMVSSEKVRGNIITHIYMLDFVYQYGFLQKYPDEIDFIIRWIRFDILDTIKQIHSHGDMLSKITLTEREQILLQDILYKELISSDEKTLELQHIHAQLYELHQCIEQKNDAIANIQQELQEKNRYLETILHSPTFKIGSAILYVPKLIYRFIHK
ncbi:MAG: glycosyltransferase [Lachnospiraceae bacterium]